MRIGMLLMGGTYPPDIRVEKEAKVLSADGHEVLLLASDKDGRAHSEQVGQIAVRRYPARAGFLASKLSAAKTLATWRSPLWERLILDYVERENLDALHVHDLPAVASALAVRRATGIPVIFDMHENYPAAVGFWKRSAAATMFQTPARYREYERSAVTNVDRVIVVVDESRDRIVSTLGADPAHVTVFGNVDDAEVSGQWLQDRSNGFVVAYAGGFGPHRGIDVLIRALALLRCEVGDAKLLLMGAGQGESELRALAVAEGVAGAIEWTGWVDGPTMRRRLGGASVGVVPHQRNEHTDSTIPHKLFQYMAMGLPVTVTDCAPLARIVNETGAGTVSLAGDAADLARALRALADPTAAASASEAGREAVRDRYNLEREGLELQRLYRELGD